MADADDYTRCVNCDCSLCLITGCWFDYCLECYKPICFDCQSKNGMRVKSEGKYGHTKEYTEPEDILPPYRYHHEDSDDFKGKNQEPGILGGCPWCKSVSDEEVFSYLLTQSGKTRDEIVKEIQDAKD